MGFPLRSNIFAPSSPHRAYFRRYPVQIAVLFSPSHRDFADSFRDAFLALDRLTGDAVAFFAVLDPPADWSAHAIGRSWWIEYQRRVGTVGHSHDDEVLVAEIARLFGVDWSELPALAVGTDLWTGEAVVCGTGPWQIVGQLQLLTSLVRKWQQPALGRIAAALATEFPFEVRPVAPEFGRRQRLSDFYDVLTLPVHQDNGRALLERRIDRQIRSVQHELRTLRTPSDAEGQADADAPAVDALVSDAMGRLVAPATMALQAVRQMLGQDRGAAAELDDESRVMLASGLRVGHFLELLDSGEFGGWVPPQRPIPRLDFTPGASGAWRALEREVNLSLIQAARHSRGVAMPDLFAWYDPELPEDRARVVLVMLRGRPVKDINAPDWRTSRRLRPTGRSPHMFLSLGEARLVVEALEPDPAEGLRVVLLNCLPGGLPANVLDGCRRMAAIRNKGSHVSAIDRREYAEVLQIVQDPHLLEPLLRIKRYLSRSGLGIPT